MRIHLTGAAGTGTTTLGRALAAAYDVPAFDTDSFYWLPTDPPFREPRPVPERLALLAPALNAEAWVLSGSLCGWGDPLIPRFEVVVFLQVPRTVRLKRLATRERERYGSRIAAGSSMHAQFVEFMRWAGEYETGPAYGRSLAMHERWLASILCPVIRMAGTESPESRLERLRRSLRELGITRN